MINEATAHPANTSEMTNFEDNIKPVNNKGTRVLYHQGANSKTNTAALIEQKLRDGIMRNKPKGKKDESLEQATQ